jgi:RNA polymerase sigma-B factor
MVTTPTATTILRFPRRGAAGSATTEQLLRRYAALTTDHPDRERLRARIIEDNLPMAGRLARRYAGRGEPYDDLAQVAALALVRAVDGYDPSREVPFSGYAVPTILGALRRHFRDTTWAIRVPRSAQELSGKLTVAIGELSQRHGRHPTSPELAHHLEVSVDELLATVAASRAYHLASLNAPLPGADNVEAIELLGAIDPGYSIVDDHLALRPLLAALPLRERRILAMRFYRHMTQERIAVEVGVSQMQVSRLLKQSLAQLRAGMPS